MAAGTVSTNVNDISVNLTKTGKVSSNPVVTNVDDSVYENIDYNKNANEYNYNDFVEDLGDAAACFVASTVNLAVAFVEGIVSFGEALVDTGVIAITTVGSIFMGFKDIYDGLRYGDWSFDDTKNLWKDTMSYVAEDYTSNLFSIINGEGTWLNENAASSFKRDGSFYAISKGVGYYTGVTATAMLTGGASASGTIMSQMPNAIVAGTAQLGKSSQKNYNDYVRDNYGGDSSKITSDDITTILVSSAGEAALEAGTVWITRDGGAQSFVDKLPVNKLAKTVHLNIGTKAMTQAGKEYVKEGIKTASGVHSKYDFDGASQAAVSAAIGEAIAGYTGNGGTKISKTTGKPLASQAALRQNYTSPGGSELAKQSGGVNADKYVADTFKGLGGKVTNRYIKELAISASNDILEDQTS